MLKLEARPQPSSLWSYGSPVLALLITVVIGTFMFTALGKDPVKGLEMFFWLPIKNAYAIGELLVKATPLLIIALGLAVCFRSNVWNIGAEGQYIMGAIFAGRRGADGRQDHRGVDRGAHHCRGRSGWHVVGRPHGFAARPLQRQRDFGEPDAGIRGRAGAELHGGRAVDGPAGL